MDVPFYNGLLRHFDTVPDPRCGNAQLHLLTDIFSHCFVRSARLRRHLVEMAQ